MSRLARHPLVVLALLAAVCLPVLVGELAAQPPAAQAQTTENIQVVLAGDISPPTNETKGDDHATAELIAKINPAVVCLPGDVMYEYGAEAMFRAETGFHGSYGRLLFDRIICPAVGNHDAADPGPGSPGWYNYFKPNLTGLACLTEPIPCRPERGYYVVDLPTSPGSGRLGWWVAVLDSNCQRAGGGTGDTQTESCASGGPMLTWLRDAIGRRNHLRRCGMVIWHHERWGTGFFADDPAVAPFWSAIWPYRPEFVGNGHSHSLARMGPMRLDGTLAPDGAGIRQFTAGASGRSLTPNRVEPARVGTRERYNTKYGVLALNLFSTPNPDGTMGGYWHSQFRFVDGSMSAVATAGCWL